MKSRLILLACCLSLFSCGQSDKTTGKAPEFAVITCLLYTSDAADEL